MAEGERAEAGRERQIGQMLAVLVLGIALGAFIVQNTQKTTIEWLAWDGTQPLWLILVITSLVSVVIARLVGALVRRSRR